MLVRYLRSAVALLLLTVGHDAVPAFAQVLSCAMPTNQIIMHCERATCDEGFLVYHLPTGFPCETRPDIREIEHFHVNLLSDLLKLAALSEESGVYGVNFLNCTRDSIATIPWETLSQRDKAWEQPVVEESDWQLSERSDRLTLVGRELGCTLSLSFNPLGENVETLKKLKRHYRWEQYRERAGAFVRLWLVPLLFVPAIAALSGLWARKILMQATEPRRLIPLLLPVIIQSALFLHVLEPAQNIWLGPYRLLFILPAAGIFVVWLLELIYLWKALSDWLDTYVKPTTIAEAEHQKEKE